MEVETLSAKEALELAVPSYLELLELAPAVLEAGEEDELQALRAAAAQLGVPLLALARRLELDGLGEPPERALLQDLAESLVILIIVQTPAELERSRLLASAALHAQATALGLTVG